MQIRATKVFAKELNKRIKGNYCIDSVTLVQIPHDNAYNLIGGGWNDSDIDFSDWSVKCLKVIYKPECYAMDRYVSTGELNKLCRHINELTIENYVSEFLNEYEI